MSLISYNTAASALPDIYTLCLRVHAHAASKDKGRERYHYRVTAYKQ